MWDDDHLFFADICSPQTIANLRAGSLIEVNVVGPFVRKGYRFKGRAVIGEPGSVEFAEGVERMRADAFPLIPPTPISSSADATTPLARPPRSSGPIMASCGAN